MVTRELRYKALALFWYHTAGRKQPMDEEHRAFARVKNRC